MTPCAPPSTELQGGAGSALTSSGLMANTLSILAATEAGGEILAADCIYGPVRNFLLTQLSRYGITTRFFAPRMGAEIADLITDKTQAILLESPGSLTMEMQDVPAIARIARDKGVTTIIDDTWSAGLTFKPLQLGVDYAVQALTKYVGGRFRPAHGRCRRARDEALFQRLQTTERAFGFHTGPDDAYLALRGPAVDGGPHGAERCQQPGHRRLARRPIRGRGHSTPGPPGSSRPCHFPARFHRCLRALRL